jgi:hypothetical protein
MARCKRFEDAAYLTVRCPRELIRAIEQFADSEFAGRCDAVRLLLERGLERSAADAGVGVWFRRGRLVIVSPDSQRARCQAETPLIALFRFPGPALTPITTNPTSAGRLPWRGSRNSCTRYGSGP